MAPVYDNAAYFARLTDATVHIAYVLDVAGFTAYPVDSSWENMYDVLLAEGKNIVAKRQKRSGVARHQMTTGSLLQCSTDTPQKNWTRTPGAMILTSLSSDHTGEKGLDRLLIGSVADKVVRGAKVPVLIIRSR